MGRPVHRRAGVRGWKYQLVKYGVIAQSNITKCQVGLEIEVCSKERPPGELRFVSTGKADPQKCPGAAIVATSKLYKKTSEDEFSIPVERRSKLWNLSAVIFTLGAEPSTVEIRFGPLPNIPITGNQQVTLIPGCNGRASSPGVNATVKVGNDRGGVEIDQDQLEALEQAECLSVSFPDGSSFMQRDLAVQSDGQGRYKIDFKWEKTRIVVRDAASKEKVNNATAQHIDFTDACQVIVHGMTVEYLEDCRPRILIAADGYESRKVDLVKGSTPVELWPDQADIVVDLVDGVLSRKYKHDKEIHQQKACCPDNLEVWTYHVVKYGKIEHFRVAGCRVGLEIVVCSAERPPGELFFEVTASKVDPDKCPHAEILVTSKLYGRASDGRDLIPIESHSKLRSFATVIFIMESE